MQNRTLQQDREESRGERTTLEDCCVMPCMVKTSYQEYLGLALVDSQIIKTLPRSAKVAIQQLNRKRKLSMDSKERLNQDGCFEQAEEEKRPRDGAAPLSHVPSAAAQDTWSWEQYLKEQKAVATPVELFSKDQSFPEHKNGFQVGMRLEGIDPRHPSVFCVLSVTEVCGYHLRLHFDGYLSCYGFWTNAGSPDIHPVEWCEKTKHELHIPKGYRKDKFVWMDSLKACKLQNAPKKLFRNKSSNGPIPKEFQVRIKLEAVDRKNPSLVCVATIADIVEDRLLVHFDNWDDSYDYWCDVNSPYVQPVGWCQENGRTLRAPQGYPDPENFSWTEYLEATHTSAVPAKFFKMRLPHGFLPNMKLEVVDKNPRLIHVATIIDVDDQRIKVYFDGWEHKYDYWMDADSPDIHPIGWCDVTGHPVEMPYRANDMKILLGQAVCPTPGCRGIGHIHGPRYSRKRERKIKLKAEMSELEHRKTVNGALGCPYSDMNLKKEATLQDRLTEQTQANLELDSSHSKLKNPCSFNFSGKHEKVNSQPRLVQQAKCLKIQGKDDIDLDNLFREYPAEQTQQALHQSVFLSSLSAHSFWDLPLSREQHCKLLPGVADIQAGKVAPWTVGKVAEFVSLLGCEEHAKCFKKERPQKRLDQLQNNNAENDSYCARPSAIPGPLLSLGSHNSAGQFTHEDAKVSEGKGSRIPVHIHLIPEPPSLLYNSPRKLYLLFLFVFIYYMQQIDGKAFLLLTQMDIVKVMKVKLGPALKIYNSVLMFRNFQDLTEEVTV
ncbi:LOW QUALITY PROTEIN: lethal(3)malignant brain tumor-like protein 4 [Hipposideros larvatus]